MSLTAHLITVTWTQKGRPYHADAVCILDMSAPDYDRTLRQKMDTLEEIAQPDPDTQTKAGYTKLQPVRNNITVYSTGAVADSKYQASDDNEIDNAVIEFAKLWGFESGVRNAAIDEEQSDADIFALQKLQNEKHLRNKLVTWAMDWHELSGIQADEFFRRRIAEVYEIDPTNFRMGDPLPQPEFERIRDEIIETAEQFKRDTEERCGKITKQAEEDAEAIKEKARAIKRQAEQMLSNALAERNKQQTEIAEARMTLMEQQGRINKAWIDVDEQRQRISAQEKSQNVPPMPYPYGPVQPWASGEQPYMYPYFQPVPAPQVPAAPTETPVARASDPEPVQRTDTNAPVQDHQNDTPASAPTPDDAAKPTAQPAAEPEAQLATEPETETTEEPETQSATKPEAQLTEKPTAQSATEPRTETTKEPETQLAKESTTPPATEPGTETTKESKKQPAQEPETETTKDLAKQPTTEPEEQPTGEPEEQPTGEPEAQPTGEPEAQPTGEPEAQPTGEPEAQPTGEPEAQPTGEPEAQPTGEPEAQPAAEPGTETAEDPEAQPATEPDEDPNETQAEQPPAPPASNPDNHENVPASAETSSSEHPDADNQNIAKEPDSDAQKGQIQATIKTDIYGSDEAILKGLAQDTHEGDDAFANPPQDETQTPLETPVTQEPDTAREFDETDLEDDTFLARGQLIAENSIAAQSSFTFKMPPQWEAAKPATIANYLKQVNPAHLLKIMQRDEMIATVQWSRSRNDARKKEVKWNLFNLYEFVCGGWANDMPPRQQSTIIVQFLNTYANKDINVKDPDGYRNYNVFLYIMRLLTSGATVDSAD